MARCSFRMEHLSHGSVLDPRSRLTRMPRFSVLQTCALLRRYLDTKSWSTTLWKADTLSDVSRRERDETSYDLVMHHLLNLSLKSSNTDSGGLVPDIYQQFTKNQGVFSNPTSKSSPAKLRLAFEAAPFGLLVEKAGGKTSDGVTGGSILDVQINGVDQRTALCIGSKNEVDRFNEYLELK